jgi:hypothetical protein
MRTQFARFAVLVVALLSLLAIAGSASATTRGIQIFAPQLVLQRGVLRFREQLGFEVICNVTLTKTLITEQLIPVRSTLTRLGRITSGRFGIECPGTVFLNLPRNLGGFPAPGPNPESWDLSFLSSNLPEGQLNFGILDFQVLINFPGMACLYRGSLLGTLSNDGRILRYSSVLPISGLPGFCSPMVTVTGIFGNEPPIIYALLPQS